MADLSQHTNYTGAYSGLLDNLWVTLAIGAACLVGHEIEVRVPRRHGKQGTFRRVPVRVVLAARRQWSKWRSGRRKEVEDGNGALEKETLEKDELKEARRRLGARESWEFG